MFALVAAVVLHSTSFSQSHPVTGEREHFSPPPLIEAEGGSLPAPKRAFFGLVFDAGAPSGAGASLAWRPLSWLQLELGGATNGAAPGFRGGVVFSPLRTFARPTLSVHAGRFARGDAQPLVRFVTANDGFHAPILDALQYDYASAHLGLELGPPDGTSFFLRGGLSRTVVRFGGFEDQLRELSGDPSLSATTPELQVTSPSFQLGVAMFF